MTHAIINIDVKLCLLPASELILLKYVEILPLNTSDASKAKQRNPVINTTHTNI